tara:strand:+ start:358 stop:474 length:117 start_codon:yes stop_codon:yes gene_type:complete
MSTLKIKVSLLVYKKSWALNVSKKDITLVNIKKKERKV